MAGGAVPAQYAPIFRAAGAQYGIPPAVLAGISSVESNLGRNNGPSSTGATGPMQFEPGTARSLGVNPADPRSAIFGAAKLLVQYGYRSNPTRAIGAYNGGPGNPQMGYAQQVLAEAKRLAPQLGAGGGGGGGLTLGPVPTTNLSIPISTFNQAGYNAAKARYIAGSAVKQADSSSNPFGAVPGASKGLSDALGPDSGALFSRGLLTTSAPNPQNFVKTSMQQIAVHGLQQLTGTGLVNAHPDARGYVNPIPGAVIGRTDQGVDANLRPGAPIRAIGNSQVVSISPNWYKGQPLVMLKLLSGPQAGRMYYVAEQIAPSVRVGQTVRAGQPIGRYASAGTGIEIGWGAPGGKTLAQATTGYTEGQQTQAGQSFRSFLGSLGA